MLDLLAKPLVKKTFAFHIGVPGFDAWLSSQSSKTREAVVTAQLRGSLPQKYGTSGGHLLQWLKHRLEHVHSISDCLNLGPKMWHSGLSHRLRHCHLTKVLVGVLDAPLLIQLSANVPGSERWPEDFGSCYRHGKFQWSFGLTQP